MQTLPDPNKQPKVAFSLAIDQEFFLPLDQMSTSRGRPANDVIAQLRIALTAACAVMARSSKWLWFQSLGSAKSSLTQAEFRFKLYQDQLSDASAVLQRIPNVNLLMLFVCALAAPIAVSAEIGTTFFVLPSLLNIPSNTWLGVAVGCTPLVATVAVKLAFDWLFHAIAVGRSNAAGSWPHKLAIVLDSSLYMGVLVANILMAADLAMGREEAFRIINALSDPTATLVVDQQVIHKLLLSVGIVAMIDSALALGKLARLCEEFRQRYKAKREVIVLRTKVEAAHKEVAEATAHQAGEQYQWDEREEKAAELKEAHQQKYLVKIAELEALGTSKQLSRSELVTALLAPGTDPLSVN